MNFCQYQIFSIFAERHHPHKVWFLTVFLISKCSSLQMLQSNKCPSPFTSLWLSLSLVLYMFIPDVLPKLIPLQRVPSFAELRSEWSPHRQHVIEDAHIDHGIVIWICMGTYDGYVIWCYICSMDNRWIIDGFVSSVSNWFPLLVQSCQIASVGSG